MKWLADYVDVKDVDIRDYCEKLTYTGSKVEGYEVLGEDIINVVVARIVKMERHPDSDHLFICQVDCGAAADGIQQIVTGAQNIFEGHRMFRQGCSDPHRCRTHCRMWRAPL